MAALSKWHGPVSLALLVEETMINTVYLKVHSDPLLFERTEIHLIIASTTEALDRKDTLSIMWDLAVDAAHTDFVMPVPFMRNHSHLPEDLYERICKSAQFTAVGNLLSHTNAVLAVTKGNGPFVVSKRRGFLPRFQNDEPGHPLIRWTEALIKSGVRIIRLEESVSEIGQMIRHEVASMWWTDPHIARKEAALLEPGLRAYSNFMEPIVRVAREDISMVTQISSSRVSRLVLVASRWRGPMSVSVFVGSDQVDELANSLGDHAKHLQEVSIHLLIHDSEYKQQYPINLLRNLALDSADTDLVFMNDVDLIPSPQTRHDLVEYANRAPWKERLFNGRAALVVPAFERDSEGLEDAAAFDRLPKDRAELLPMLRDSQAMNVFWHAFRPVHASTDYPRWFKTPSGSEPYQVLYASASYEPYVLVARRRACWRLPRFWDLRGWGWNKASWIVELNASKFEFFVATGEAFLVHMNHPPSENFLKFSEDTKKKLGQLSEHLRSWLGLEIDFLAVIANSGDENKALMREDWRP